MSLTPGDLRDAVWQDGQVGAGGGGGPQGAESVPLGLGGVVSGDADGAAQDPESSSEGSETEYDTCTGSTDDYGCSEDTDDGESMRRIDGYSRQLGVAAVLQLSSIPGLYYADRLFGGAGWATREW
ncbi:hypothetical protein GPECTOR_60g747 [Gonium pectorale]|uniref:Uncharacterized protein n=1 Tax=Gonium pectorale TaxID=33097 RepID=A0A150G511_GONPE|nr:hypothetical protein GPECTOR_60g747 [Gonium pectorale]|eukprot:KXZ44969.1 hypothetical protein GPECTOR_60g747 [Gonium pectorale]